jgi:hypothetical protein
MPSRSMVAVATLALLVSTSFVHADEGARAGQDPPPGQPARPGTSHRSEVDGTGAQASPSVPAAPGLDLSASAPGDEAPSLFHRWWFWSAVGAVAVATAVTILVSSRGQAPPATDLGNQEFHP